MDRKEISRPPLKLRRLETSVKVDSEIKGGQENGLSIYSWNVNGIAPFVQPTITSFFKSESRKRQQRDLPKASLRDFLRRHQWPTVLFLQEVKINPEDSPTIRAVENAVRRQSNESKDTYDYRAHFCLPSDKYNARGFGRRVYGVCSIIRKDFEDKCVNTVRTVKWDCEGRILIVETKAVDASPKLAIINIYAVNGTDHPYKDPENGSVVGTRHDRKLKVHSLLQNECRELEARGFGVIIAGDINIARSTLDGFPNLRTFPMQHRLNRADFEARFFSSNTKENGSDSELTAKANEEGGLGMIDTFRHLHPGQKSYTFYPRSKPFGESCDRVDMILTSASLKDNIVDAGMHETTAERGPSDHTPLYATFLFG